MSVAFAGNSPPGSRGEAGPLRVMIVDDSVVVRGLISRWIDAEPDMEIVGLAAHRARGGRPDRAHNPDVVVLDIEMPDLDGISALPLLLAKKRDLVVIMASTLTRRNAEISFKALSLGAADYIPKPEINARGVGRRHLPARPDREDPPPRRAACAAAAVASAAAGARARPAARASRSSARRAASLGRARAVGDLALRAVRAHGAARAADRLLDRRAAGADRARRRARAA